MALVTAVLLGACARSDSPRAGGDGDSPISDSPGPVGPSPTPLLVEPRDDLVDPRPVGIESTEPMDDRTLRVRFYGGVEDCYGLARVDVEETADAVIVTLWEGRVPGAEICIEIAVWKAVDVTLESPLGGREVRDGAPHAA